jgi:DNA-binding CsgD family transcriptional regulator/tetratricopeptide (TPR) repeat protein
LLSRLSVFAGGWTFEAAESVCSLQKAEGGNGNLPTDILDLLCHLIDKSLVLAEEHDGTTRYRMLETIRQYAREKLQALSELDSMQDRHLDFFLLLAERLEPQLRRGRQQEYLDGLEREHDNLRVALEWSLRMHREVQMLRLGAALFLFWRQRDFWSEARKWYKVMLAVVAKPEHEAMRPTILAVAASIEMWTSNLDSAKQWARACVESSQKSGERKRQAVALAVLGEVAWEQNEFVEAQTHLEQALALFRQVDDQMGVADALHWLGHLALGQGDYGRSRAIFQDSYTRLKDFGDQVSLTLLLSDLGLVSYLQEDYAMARAYSDQGMALCRKIGSKFGMAKTLNLLGDLARCEGDNESADALYQDSLSLFKELGSSQITATLHNLAHVRLSQGDGVQAVKLFSQASNEFRELGDEKGVTDCVMGLAGVAIQMGQPEKGTRLFGACEKIKQENGTTWWPANRIAYKRYLSRLHDQLDDARFNAAWKEGRAMTLEQAIEYALVQPIESSQPSASAQPHDSNALTPREIEVLRLAQAGLSDAKIAEKLVISPRTVNTHLSSIYSKLGVNSRSAATRYASDHKII